MSASIRRNVTTVEEKITGGVTVRRHTDHDDGDSFSATLYNASGWQVGQYKTEAGLQLAIARLVSDG
jgi:hypothetical protein